jgi:acyl-phosphate glycerol 3-phosphate acyltransferase
LTTREVLIAVGLVVLGYLFGSLSPSVFLGRAFKGLDVRHHGSGNAGTTNAFRVLGKRLGVSVFILDILKGVIPVVLARYLSSPLVTVFVAFACVMGHQYSIFLRGRGGKGVATGAGCAIGMMPIPMAFPRSVHLVGIHHAHSLDSVHHLHHRTSDHGRRIAPTPRIRDRLLLDVGGSAVGASSKLQETCAGRGTPLHLPVEQEAVCSPAIGGDGRAVIGRPNSARDARLLPLPR